MTNLNLKKKNGGGEKTLKSSESTEQTVIMPTFNFLVFQAARLLAAILIGKCGVTMKITQPFLLDDSPLTKTLGNMYYYTYLIFVDTEDKGDKATCLRSPSY